MKRSGVRHRSGPGRRQRAVGLVLGAKSIDRLRGVGCGQDLDLAERLHLQASALQSSS